MKKLVLLFLIPFLFIPFFASAITSPNSFTSPDTNNISMDVGIPGYPDSLVTDCFTGLTMGSCTDFVHHQSIPYNVPVYTILSMSFLTDFYGGRFTCDNRTTWFYIDGLAEAFNDLYPIFSGSTLGLLQLHSDAPIHCTSPIIVDETDSDNPVYIWIQYVPYDTRYAGDSAPTYYDWLIPTGFILFFLSIIVLYPVIRNLFHHNRKHTL